MVELSLEQKRAVALAKARAAAEGVSVPAPTMSTSSPEFANLPVPGTDLSDPPQPPRYRSPIPGGDFMNQLATSVAENIPIVGPATSRAADQVGSNLASMINGEDPAQLRLQAQDIRERNASEQQLADTIGTVAGTVGPLMAAGATQIGGKVLGMTGPLWQRMLAGAGSGAAIGGGDTLARGGSWDDVRGSTLLGLGIGGAFPLIEKPVGALVNALMGRRVPAHARALSEAVEASRIDPTQLPQRMSQMGPDAVLADMGPNLIRQAAAIASLPGEGQTILRDALVRRHVGTSGRIINDVDAALGPAPIPSRVAAEIQTNQRAMSPEYEELFQHARPVNARPLAETFNDMASRYAVGERARTMQRISGWLNETDDQGRQFLTSDPRRLFSIREELDGMFDGETNTKVIAALTSARQQVDDLLATGVPGLKEVDARYSELARQAQALGDGNMVLGTGKEAVHPADLVEMLAAGPQGLATGPSAVPFRLSQGARAEIDRLIGTSSRDLERLKSAVGGFGDWNRDKLASLFGQERADALLGIIDREMAYTRTYNTVTQNSESAARLAAQQQVGPWQAPSGGPLEWAMKGPQWAANAAARARSQSVNSKLAEALMSGPTPELVDQLIAARKAGRAIAPGAAASLMLTGPQG